MKNAADIAGEEAAILSRLIKPQEKLTQAAARALLKFEFGDQDRQRMHELAEKNQAEGLTPQEERELLGYLKVGLLIDVIHAKARNSLQMHGN